ncbi:iron chaperone [Hydrogenophaga sp. RWCD_12]|uniref:iron chaperone n=1 Tax=Hydrogenophaga sp. RWCD_12 TaxID=3391190 RepID=UPI003984C674
MAGAAAPKGFADHAAYIAAASDVVQPLLREILARVQALIPDAQPCISYQMPAFRTGPAIGKAQGKVFFYCAAFQRHIGVYPPVTNDLALVEELAPWRNEKGNLAFPLNQPMPFALIERVALALAVQYAPPTPWSST